MAQRQADRLSAGRRDRLITLEARPSTDTIDSEGAPIDGPWTTLEDAMPAAKIELAGSEHVRANQVTARSDQRWEINYRADMDPDLVDVPKLRRVVLNAGAAEQRVLEIVAAVELGRRAGLALYTIAKVG